MSTFDYEKPYMDNTFVGYHGDKVIVKQDDGIVNSATENPEKFAKRQKQSDLDKKTIESFIGKKWSELSDKDQRILLERAAVTVDFVKADGSCNIEFTDTPLVISGHSNDIDDKYVETPNDNAVIGTIDNYLKNAKMSIEDDYNSFDGVDIELKRPAEQVEFEAEATSIMMQHYCGIEIAKSRLRHLSDCYNEMLSDKNITSKDVIASLERAHKAYKQIVTAVNTELKPELTQNKAQASSQTTENIKDAHINTQDAQTQTSATPQQPILPCQLPDMGMGGMNFGM